MMVSPITPHPAAAVSWCSADASAGSSWISLGAQTWVIIQLQISMKLVQTGLDNMSQATRKGTGWTQHAISFVFIARLGQQQQSALKKAIQNPRVLGRTTNTWVVFCFCTATQWLLSGRKGKGVSKKTVFSSSASSAHCAVNLLMAESVPSATCLSVRLILKCLFQDPLTQVQVMKKPRELLPLWMCSTLHAPGKVLVPHNLCKVCLPSSCRAERFWLSDALELYFTQKTCWCKN